MGSNGEKSNVVNVVIYQNIGKIYIIILLLISEIKIIEISCGKLYYAYN